MKKALPGAIARVCALTTLCAHSSLVAATEWTLSGIVGAGDHVNIVGVEAQVPGGYGGRLSEQWSWALAWAGDVSYWWARNHAASNSSLWEAGLSPVINLRAAAGSGVSYYLEAGVGVHLLSHTIIDERQMSTAFQFGELAGAGINFGDQRRCGIGLRVQHLSNARIKQPNDGATFGELRISYRWD